MAEEKGRVSKCEKDLVSLLLGWKRQREKKECELNDQTMNFGWQSVRKQGPHFYSHQKMNSTKNLNEFESGFFLRAST